MATRTIRTIGDDVLTKVCKEVKEVTPKTKELIDDMFETMYDAMGVGLAANQVGMLKRIVVIDCGDDPHVLINPVIIETAGEQRGYEGCLSVPLQYTTATLLMFYSSSFFFIFFMLSDFCPPTFFNNICGASAAKSCLQSYDATVSVRMSRPCFHSLR